MTNQLRRELTLPYLSNQFGYPIYLGSFLMPGLACRTNLYDCDIERFLDKWVRREAGNENRVFLDCGTWSKESKKNTHQPIIEVAGKYPLPDPDEAETEMINYINEDWLDQVVRRLVFHAERRISITATAMDDTTIHNRKKTHWALYWGNPDNNDQNLHPKPEVFYHYPEWQDPAAPNPPAMKLKAKNSGLIKEAFNRTILELIFAEIPRRYHRYINIEAGNEVAARIRWHKIQDLLYKEPEINVPRRLSSGKKHYRRLSSMGQPRKPQKDRWWFYRTKSDFNKCVHNLPNVAAIQQVIDDWAKVWPPDDPLGRKPIREKFLPSTDGVNVMPSPATIGKMTKFALENKLLGIECRGGLWGGVPLDEVDFRHPGAMMRAFRDWLDGSN